MANVKLPQEIIDMLGQQEAKALLEGLNDPETRKNPAFLGKVRQFLKDNNFITFAFLTDHFLCNISFTVF